MALTAGSGADWQRRIVAFSGTATGVGLLSGLLHLLVLIEPVRIFDANPPLWQLCDDDAPRWMHLGGSFAASYGAWALLAILAWITNRAATAEVRGRSGRRDAIRWTRRIVRIATSLLALSLTVLPLQVSSVGSEGLAIYRLVVWETIDPPRVIIVSWLLAVGLWTLVWWLRPARGASIGDERDGQERHDHLARVGIRWAACLLMTIGGIAIALAPSHLKGFWDPQYHAALSLGIAAIGTGVHLLRSITRTRR